MYPFIIQSVISFTKGEGIFVYINREWKIEYNRQYNKKTNLSVMVIDILFEQSYSLNESRFIDICKERNYVTVDLERLFTKVNECVHKQGIEQAFIYKNFHIVSWLYEKGASLNPDMINLSVKRGDIDRLDWLTLRKCYPVRTSRLFRIANRNIQIWLTKYLMEGVSDI